MKKTDSFHFLLLLRDIEDLNVESAIDGIGGSRSMYKTLLNRVIGLIPGNIEAMDKFLSEDENLSAFAIKVHGVKGSLRQIGCQQLADFAESLEKAAKAGDKHYCDMNYEVFKERFLKFYEQVQKAIQSSEDAAENTVRVPGDIKNYIEVLLRIKEAAAGFDSTLAAKNIAPLLKINFSGDIDFLLQKAATELESYHCRKALVYITEILLKCSSNEQCAKGDM